MSAHTYDKDTFTQAFLAEEVYGEYKDGKLSFKHRKTDAKTGQQYIEIEYPDPHKGTQRFDILENYEGKHGFQGTIYRNHTTGDIHAAVRGTEFDREFMKDVVWTDGINMGLLKTNPQLPSAVEFTRLAIGYAEREAARLGYNPQINLTGHSLGGNAVQYLTHYFGDAIDRADTFNAYGARSLNANIPEHPVPHNITNHVMATDVVSAVSRHYGKVQMYASPLETERLKKNGYENNASIWDFRIPGAPFMRGKLGTHTIAHFTGAGSGETAFGGREINVLLNPEFRRHAQEFEPMIHKFRRDVEVSTKLLVNSLNPVSGFAKAVGDSRPVAYGERYLREGGGYVSAQQNQRTLLEGKLEAAEAQQHSPLLDKIRALQTGAQKGGAEFEAALETYGHNRAGQAAVERAEQAAQMREEQARVQESEALQQPARSRGGMVR